MSYCDGDCDGDGSDNNSEDPPLEDDDKDVDELSSDSTTHDGFVSDRNEDSASDSEIGSSDSSSELDPGLQEIKGECTLLSGTYT